MKNKKIISLLFLIFVFAPFSIWAATFNYKPMENIPGFEGVADLPSYILAIYKFGIWAIGLAAMLMIMIGGYMYIMSAGNNASMGKAKSIITDAIAGLILALTSYLLLYTINPELVRMNFSGSGGGVNSGNGSGGGGSGGSGGAGNGTCTPISSGPCSVSSLQSTCFSSNATQASSICNAESHGDATIPSGVDKCKDGNSASWGLFQINITTHKVGGLDCPSAFSGGAYTSKNHNCVVSNQNLYNQCVAAAKNPANNIAAACKISGDGTHWGQWGANSKCGFNR